MSRFSFLRDLFFKRTLRRAVFLQNLRLLAIGSVLVGVGGAGLGIGVWRSYVTTQDVAGVPERRSVAEVTSVTDRPAGRVEVVVNGLIFLRLNGKTVVATVPVRGFDPLRAGQKVEVGYRVGKSGRVLVGWIKPVGGGARP